VSRDGRVLEKGLGSCIVLNDFDSTWDVKCLIVTRSNLVVTWRVRPHMGIISWFPRELCWFL
jgi:hypothetical protein